MIKEENLSHLEQIKDETETSGKTEFYMKETKSGQFTFDKETDAKMREAPEFA